MIQMSQKNQWLSISIVAGFALLTAVIIFVSPKTPAIVAEPEVQCEKGYALHQWVMILLKDHGVKLQEDELIPRLEDIIKEGDINCIRN